MQEFPELTKVLLLRKLLRKEGRHYTETETHVLISIYILNSQDIKCSGCTIFKFLAKIHRTPYKQKLLLTIKKLQQDGFIRIIGRGCETKIQLRLDGTLYLQRLDQQLLRIKD